MKKHFSFLGCVFVLLCAAAQAQPYLYGVASAGGNYAQGTIFSLNVATGDVEKKWDFDSANGQGPHGKLLQAANGIFYGTTVRGGAYNKGVLFSFDASAAKFLKLWDFDGLNGSTPMGSLIQASDGKLYGTASGGGMYDGGTIFSFDPATATFKKHWDFNIEVSAGPSGGLIQASDGRLYGLTVYGSIANGTMYSYNLTTETFTKLWDFEGYPMGSLVEVANGKLYGTEDGGRRILFSYDLSTDTLKTLWDFIGIGAAGNLVQATDERLYGITMYGSNDEGGTIFSYDPATNKFNVHFDFVGSDNGYQPSGGLMQATNSKLYGTTIYGGDKGYGVIYSFDIEKKTYKKVWDFSDATGRSPSGPMVEYNPVCTPIKYYRDADEDGFGDFNNSVDACERPDGYVINNTDCDDSDETTYPGAPEIMCDNKDHNCDGFLDEGFLEKWFVDTDEDGYGGPEPVWLTDCEENEYPNGALTKDSTDCDDGEHFTNPGVAEVCGDRVDNNCNGKIDESCTPVTTWYRDADGDGFGNPASSKAGDTQPRGYVSNALDCNDKNKVNGGPEVCDGIDNDCDGIIDNGLNKWPWYSDWDGDGYGTPKRMVMACSPPPRFVSNSRDQNDDNKNVYPGAPELCDGRDNNQNGVIDEGFTRTTFYHDFDKDGYGRNEVTLAACAAPLNYVAVGGDCNDRNAAIHPGAVGPPNDGIDNNCNGLIDEPLRNTTSSKGGDVISEQQPALQLRATPNPSQHYFSLRIESTSNSLVQVRITDVLGRLVEARQNITPNITLTVGHTYRTGMYYVQVLQGTEKVTLKLVKAAQ